MTERVSVGIIGASGYGGVQLVRLLLEHPKAELAYLGGSTSVGKTFDDIYPHLGVTIPIENLEPEAIAQRCQIVFLALPNGLACQISPRLLAAGCQVLDLSADYRFRNLQTYETWYKSEKRHDQETVHQAVYGLPELYRPKIQESALIGCPGCYPTASLLAIIPLLKQGLIDVNSIIIDAKSGTSGGGRQPKINLLFAEAQGSVGAYGIASHRHTPEIEQICTDVAGQEVIVQFTPHLIPMVRGILATVYAQLRDPGLVKDDLLTIYRSFYRTAPWVRILSGTGNTYPQTKWAWGTNLCFMGMEVDPRTGRVIVVAAIDNLMKGQAGQAIQCMNIMLGWDEMIGLPQRSFYP